MRILRPKEVAWAAVIVFVFWWAVLFVVGGQRYASFLDVLHGLGGWVFGAATGFAVALIWYSLDRSAQIEKLLPDTWNGASATLGKVPIHHARLAAAEKLPTVQELAAHMPAEVRSAGEESFLHDWISANKDRAPGHVELLGEILRVLWHERIRTWPATHHSQDPHHNHGGRTLLTHSLLVCWLTLRERQNYVYEPAKAPSGYQLVHLRDPNFSFNADDPLIPILGLGHDLGKIECYVWQDNALVDCTKDHDLVGARIMARMENYWHEEISAADLDVMQPILAHYHHPSAVPMAKDGGVLSDRLHALLELLIRCDRIAGAMENGRSRANIQADLDSHQAFEASGNPSAMKDAIVEVLTRSGRVNSKETRTNVGIKYLMPQYRRTVLVLKEDVFVQQVAEVAKLEEVRNRPVSGANPVNALTREILIWLGENNLLFTDHEPSGRAAESSLYKTSFYVPKDYFEDKAMQIPQDNPNNPKFTWGSCILLAPEALEELLPLSNIENYWLVPHFSVARTGSQGAFRKKSEAEEAAQEDSNDAFLRQLAADFPALDEKKIDQGPATEEDDAIFGADRSATSTELTPRDDHRPEDGQVQAVAEPVSVSSTEEDDAIFGVGQAESDQAESDQAEQAEVDDIALLGDAPTPENADDMLGDGALFRMRLLAAAASGEVQQKALGGGLLALFDLEQLLGAAGWSIDDVKASSAAWREDAQIVWIEHKVVKALGRVGLVVTLHQ